jgi:hypothetical protein
MSTMHFHHSDVTPTVRLSISPEATVHLANQFTMKTITVIGVMATLASPALANVRPQLRGDGLSSDV